MARILLFGLESTVADELSIALRQVGECLQTAAHDPKILLQSDFELVFTPAGQLTIVHECCPGVPVVVVSRIPEVSAWLDALEKGAADYCGAPFEARQVRWLMHSTMTQAHRRAAA
jgi:DNA-binding NtrC family response regulator